MYNSFFLFLKKFWSRILFFTLGLGSLGWFLVRVIPKPSRAAYPCMRAAAPLASSFVAYLIGIGTFTLLMRKARERFRHARYVVASLFIVAGLATGFVTISLNNAKLNAQSLQDKQDPNMPLGQGKGIFPGRVVWVHNPDATNKNCTDGSGDYWYMDKNTDQEIVDNMFADGLKRLTGENTLAEAWDAIFHSYNNTHGRGDVGYQAGEKIVIKINLNGQGNSNPNANVNTSPQICHALLDHLINTCGVAQTDISIGDPNVSMNTQTYSKLHGSFPNVVYWGSGAGLTTASSTGTPVFFSSDGDLEYVLPQAYVNATYMINAPVFKKHHRAGISIAAKNHFGSFAPYYGGAWNLHYSLPCPDATSVASNGNYGVYRCFVDIMGHKDLGGKTILYLVDGIWGSTNWGHPPVKWAMTPFNNDWPNSMFLSQDPVAVESVCFDFLYEEFDENHPTEGVFVGDSKGPYPHFPGTDDYLHQAADPSLWPAGIEYDPENDGSVLTSMGTHEHWNNSVEKKYTRNLGTGTGIELSKLSSVTQITPENSDLLSGIVRSIYVDSFDVKWFGTDMGVSRYDGNNWSEFTTATVPPSGAGLLSNNIRNIAYEKTNYGHEIWLATDGGLAVAGFNVDGITSATTYSTSNSDIISNDILSVGVDVSHNRWAATPIGLSIYRGSAWADTNRYMGEDDHDTYLNWGDLTVSAMASYAKDSMIYIATDSSGILRFSHDPVDGITGASPFSSTWSHLCKTVNSVTIRDTVQWYGTPIGAYMHLGSAAKSFWIYYPVDSGLISPNVTAIEVDDAGNVWFGTDKGLTVKTDAGWMQYPGGMQAADLVFNPDTIQVAISWTNGNGIGEGQGLVNPKVNDIKKDFNGKIWVATDGGIEFFEEVPASFGTGFAARRLVFMKEGNSGSLTLTDGTHYVDNSQFGAGTEVSGWYCVYSGSSNSVSVTGLQPETEYRVMVCEFYGSPGSEVYAQAVSSGNPANFTTDEGYDNLIEFDNESVVVYPVPFDDYLMISASPDISGTAAFYTLDGKLSRTERFGAGVSRINTEELKSGIYILKITDGDKSYSCRIVK
jgi:hypothetical protein